MSSNTISFSFTGFSDVVYGAAFLTGIYAGVAIVREFFAYKKEELYVNANMKKKCYRFDINGEPRYKHVINKGCADCTGCNDYFDYTCCSGYFDGSIKNTRRVSPIDEIKVISNSTYTCTAPSSENNCNKQSQQTQQTQQSQQSQQSQQTQQKNATNLQSKQNNALAEMVDFDNNTLHVIEEYK